MLGRKVVKGKQDFFIFLQASAGFWEFGLVTGDELIIGCQSRFAGGRQVHFMDQLLRLALYALRHFIQDIGGLMDESIAAARLGRILPAERSRSQANRHRWPASVRSKAPGVLAAEAVHARIECFRGNRQRQLRVPWCHPRWLRSTPARRFALHRAGR